MKRVSGLATFAFALLAMVYPLATASAAPLTKPNFARVKVVSPFEIDLTWRDRSSDADGYLIERSTNHTHFRQIAQLLPGTTVYRDKNLFPGTRYFYRIRSFKASGISRYDSISARTQTPVVPLSVADWGYPVGFVSPTNTDLVSVSPGAAHSLGLKRDGTVIAWGYEFLGGAAVPTNLDHVIAISAGYGSSLALKSDGTVVEWGNDGGGGSRGSRPPIILPPPISILPTNIIRPPIPLPIEPLPIHPLQPAQPISPPVIQPIQLNPQPQPLSSPRLTAQTQPSPPDGLTDVVAISAGYRHSLALKSDGTVVAWGFDDLGDTDVPPGLNGVVEIAAGQTYNLALKSDGTVVGWGGGTSGAGTPPTNLTSVISIAAGPDTGVAVKSDGTVIAWGAQAISTTTATSGLTDVRAVALGGSESSVLKKDGSLFNWVSGDPSFIVPDFGASVVAISANGNHFIALSTAPAAPSNPFTTVLSANQLRLSWQDNSSDEKSFAIERSNVSNDVIVPWTQIGTVAANHTNFTDTAVQTNFSYTYRVRAIGKFGTSPYCTEINTVVSPLPAPSPLAATLNLTNEVSLSWIAGLGGTAGYKIERAPDNNGAPGAWQEIGSVNVTNFFTSSFSDAGIQAGNTYWYRVRAFNVLGFSPYNDPISVSVTPPLVPNGLGYTSYGSNVSIFWSANLNSPTPTGYQVETAPDINGAPGPWTEVTNVPPTLNVYTDIGRAIGETEWYRVRAYNWVGDSPYTDPFSVTISPTPTPYGLTGSLGLTPGINLHWDTTSQVDGFNVERAPDIDSGPGDWSQIAVVAVGIPAFQGSFTDTNVVANTTYWYRVRSFNALSFSDYSGPFSVSLTSPSAPTLTPSTVFAGTVSLRWQDNAPGLSHFRIERALDADGVPGAWTEIAILPGEQTFYNDSDLTAGAVYWYRIRAESWTGESPYSQVIAVTITPPAPPAIQSIVLSATNGVDLTITDRGDESGFLIERSVPTALGFVDWTQIAQLDAQGYITAYFSDTNVTVNATNMYRVRAFNSLGISGYSAVVSIPLVPPAQPSLTASIQEGTATVIWNDEYNLPNQIIEGYRLQRAPDVGGYPGTWTQITNIDADYTDVVYYDPGLNPTATYWYRVQAFNWIGNSPFSDPVSVSTTPPNPPSIQLVSLSVTNHQADIAWLNGANAEGVTIERATDQSGALGAWSQIGVVYTTNYRYGVFSDTNATANTTNWYRLRSFSASGVSDYTPPVELRIVPPSAPTLSTTVFANQVTVSWYDPAASIDGLGGYKLERAANVNGSPGAWTQLTNTASSLYVDLNLAADTTYWYRIRSYNWVGDSDYSAPVKATITPPGPPVFLFGAVGTNHAVLLHWNDSYNDEDGFKLERVADAVGSPGGNWQEIASIDASYASDASFVDTNVTADTTNWYRVRAFSSLGFSGYDYDVEVRVMPPDPPTDVSAFSSENSVQLYWFENFGIGIGNFAIQRAPDDGGAPGTWADITTNVTDMTYPDTGLPTGTTYWYRIRAFNWVGSSAFAAPVSVAVPGLLPPAPPQLVSEYPNGPSNQLFLAWSEYPNDNVDGFNLQRAPDVSGAPGSWTNIAVIYATNSSFGSFFDTSFPANSTNWYRVQAFNSAGVSGFSDSNSVAVTASTDVPSINQATALSPNRIDIGWQGPAYGFIQGYMLERAPDNAGTPGAWTAIANGDFGSYSDFAVARNQKYWYRVQSYNWSGASLFSEPVLVLDAPPAAPSLAVTNDQAQFTLSWAITDNNITSVKIDRARDNAGIPGTWLQIAEPLTIGGIIPTGYTDIGIPTGQTFSYRVRAVNAVGDSLYSNEASATAATAPSTPTPQILSITQTNGGMLIEWSTTAGNTDVVQSSGDFTRGYTNLSPALLVSGFGTASTNYFDAGALTNSPGRFYRIQSTR